jgi:hypothetical protein
MEQTYMEPASNKQQMVDEQLEEILDEVWAQGYYNGSDDEYARIQASTIAEAKRRLQALMVAERIDELQQIDKPEPFMQQLPTKAYRKVSLDEYISKRIAELTQQPNQAERTGE